MFINVYIRKKKENQILNWTYSSVTYQCIRAVACYHSHTQAWKQPFVFKFTSKEEIVNCQSFNICNLSRENIPYDLSFSQEYLCEEICESCTWIKSSVQKKERALCMDQVIRSKKIACRGLRRTCQMTILCFDDYNYPTYPNCKQCLQTSATSQPFS